MGKKEKKKKKIKVKTKKRSKNDKRKIKIQQKIWTNILEWCQYNFDLRSTAAEEDTSEEHSSWVVVGGGRKEWCIGIWKETERITKGVGIFFFFFSVFGKPRFILVVEYKNFISN